MNSFLSQIVFLFLTAVTINAQTLAVGGSEADLAYQEEYNKNIVLTKINGVYIPNSIAEAFDRINKLSPAASLDKFKNAPEKVVCKKIHFGLGRWMIEKWNFYGGSRLSHLLKIKGVLHPDDMAQFLLRAYHRSLNDLPLDEEELIAELAMQRKKIAEEIRGY